MAPNGTVTIGLGGWARRKTNRYGDPLDTPKASKADVGYVVPPEGVAICCETCSSFRPPSACKDVGNDGAVIYPTGCCNRWAHGEAKVSTYEDPNPNEEGAVG